MKGAQQARARAKQDGRVPGMTEKTTATAINQAMPSGMKIQDALAPKRPEKAVTPSRPPRAAKVAGPLTTPERNALPNSSFAGPDRSYPINDANHARNALSRSAANASPELQAQIKKKVIKRFPGINVSQA